MKKMNPDSEAVHDSQISPLMTQIIAICKKHKIPMVATFQWCDASHPNGAGFCTTRIPFEGENERLAEAAAIIQRAESRLMAFTITTEKTC